MSTFTVRPLYQIARDIQRDWVKPSPAAQPYLDAMTTLDLITDRYYADSANTVVSYFLSNAASWKGDTARTIKAELKNMVK